MNNLIPFVADDNCMGWTWFLANNFQFLLLVPLFAMLYYKKRHIFWIVVASSAAACLLFDIVVVASGDLSASYFEHNDLYWSTYYVKPYARFPVFLIGILLGCMHFASKQELLEAGRLASIAGNFRFNRMFRILSAVVGVALCFLIVLFFQLINRSQTVPTFWDALFILFSRPVFAVGVILLVYPAFLGVGFLSGFLANPFWLPFARLTFGVFLCHSIFILFREYSVERGQWANYFDTWLFFLAYTMLSYFFSLFTYLLVQAPFAQIEEDFFFKGYLNRSQMRKAIAKEEKQRKLIEEGGSTRYKQAEDLEDAQIGSIN